MKGEEGVEDEGPTFSVERGQQAIRREDNRTLGQSKTAILVRNGME